MTLVLGAGDRDAIFRHGEAAHPEECCGFLLGRDEGGDRRLVTRLARAANERTDSRTRRYLIPPEAYLEAEREAERQGLDIIGIYHSHPEAPARPSDFDRDHAFPGWSYVIVSVVAGRAGDVASWRLREDRTAFDEERMAITALESQRSPS